MSKKTIALFLVILIIISAFAGCSNDKAKNSSTDGNSDGGKYHYVISPAFAAPPDDIPEMQTYWEEKLGATFEIIYLEYANYMELLNLRVASKKVPDVINLQNISNIKKYQEDGVIGGFTREFLKESSPKTCEFIDAEMGESAYEYVTFDDLMYALPCGGCDSRFARPVIWNMNWLEAVGIKEIPKKLEDVEKAFYAFRNNDPDGNGKKDTYALSKDGMDAIFGAFGVQRTNTAQPQAMWTKDENGKAALDIANPKAKPALELLAKWYKDGIIDPEFVTGENKGGYWAVSHSFCESRIGFTNRANFYHWVTPDMEEKGLYLIGNAEIIKNSNPSLKYDFGYPPIGPNGDAGTTKDPYIYAKTGFSKNLVKDEKKFAKFIQMTETWAGLNNVEDGISQAYGIKGKHWDYDDSMKPVQKPEFTTVEAISKLGGNTTFQFYENPVIQESLDPAQYEWVKGLYDEGGRKGAWYETLISTPLPSQGEYLAEAQKVLDEGCIAIITGDKPIDYYDEMIKKYMNAGGEVLTKEANEIYSAK